MTTATPTFRPPRQPKYRAENLTAMAFQFDHLPEPVYSYTEVRWTREGADLIALLSNSLRPHKKELPIRDLRLRVQVRDRDSIGTEAKLGTGYGTAASRTLSFTGTEPDAAVTHANHAIAEWVAEAVLKLTQVDQAAAQKLRKLALDRSAVRAELRKEPVFGWETNRHTGTAKSPPSTRLFTTLADYVAVHLIGFEVFPGAAPMRAVIRQELTNNKTELMTDVITQETKNGQVKFSLGLTVSVETYPGRPLPIVKIHHKKFVWTETPIKGSTKLSGYLLPQGESRALRFELAKDLALGDDYAVLATEYDLPLPPDVTTTNLAAHGTGGHYGPHSIVITHKNGRSESEVALYGVTDLDRRLSFDRLTDQLASVGLTPWTGLVEVPSTTKAQQDADAAWKILFEDEEDEEGQDDKARPTLSANERAKAERKFAEWTARVKSNIDAHYNGQYHLVLAFADGLIKDAEKARDILQTILGAGATIRLELLPKKVHGTRNSLPGHDTKKGADRAARRLQAWQPFIEEIRKYSAEQPDNPIHGVLVLARKDGYPGHDDVINKRVARIALSKGLGLTVQYLLPIRRRASGELATNAENNYRIRVVNAWRDLAWKSLGKMDGIARKAEDILKTSGRPVLGVGIIRVNKKRKQGNDASFIPYAIELDPATGTCIGAVMLGQGDMPPRITPFMPLPDLIRELTDFGPSHLARSKTSAETDKLRRMHTQNFLHQIFVERSQINPDLIILADMSTLSGMWPWLSDAQIDPVNMSLAGESHVEQFFPDATFIRIRPDISPKVIMDTPKTKIVLNGEVRPSAKRSDADLYRVTDTEPGMDTYLSFGSKITKSLANAASCYQSITEANGPTRDPHSGAWQTPNAIDITIVRPGSLQSEALAKFVEALRSEYAHFGSWISAPGPLHFASLLKEYVPDYDIDEEEEEEASSMPLLPW